MQPCSLYILSATTRDGSPLIKIGIAANPRARLSTIQTSCPYPLDLARQFNFPDRDAAWQVEQLIHRAYSDKRTSGEWFAIPELLATCSIVSMVAQLIYVYFPDLDGCPIVEALHEIGVGDDVIALTDVFCRGEHWRSRNLVGVSP